MSYRNPGIVTDRSGELLGQALAGLGSNIARGIENAGIRRDRIKKEKEAEDKAQQKMYTDVELAGNEKAANFKADLPKTTFNEKLNPIIDARIKAAGDAKIALYQESNPAKRAELLKTISGVDNFLLSTGEYINNLAADGATWASMSITDLNNKFAVNGSDPESVMNNQGLVSFVSGKSSADFDMYFDPENNSINLNASGKIGDKSWAVTGFNSKDYLVSGGELVTDIPQVAQEVQDAAKKLVTDNKGVRLDSIAKEPDYQQFYIDVVDNKGKKTGKKLVGGKIEVIDQDEIKSLIGKEVSASVEGFLKLPPIQQNLILRNQLDSDYKNLDEFLKDNPSTDGQLKVLNGLFEELALEGPDGINKAWKSYGEGKDKVYYLATEPLKDIASAKSTGSGADTKKFPEQKAKEYYDVFRKDPAGEWERLIGTPTNYDRKNNIITVFAEQAVLDAEGAEVLGEDGFPEMTTKPIEYDMNVPLTRNTFYTRLFENSGYAGGGAAGGQLLQAFGEIVKGGTRKKMQSPVKTVEDYMKQYNIQKK